MLFTITMKFDCAHGMKNQLVKGLLVAALMLVMSAPVPAQDYPTQRLRQYAASARLWLADTVRVRESVDMNPHFLDPIFSWSEITIRAFSEHWNNISKSWQQRLQAGVRKMLIRRFTDFLLRNRSLSAEKSLRWGDETVRDQRAQVSADLLTDQDIVNLSIRLIWEDDGWKIYDIRTEQFTFRKKFFPDIRELMDENFSLEYVYAHITEDTVLIIDNFDQGIAGDFPSGWGWRKKDDSEISRDGKKYHIAASREQNYLTSNSKGQRIPLVRPFSYNIQEYPYLSWRWRLAVGNQNGGKDHSDDLNGASVTVIYYQNWLGIPVSVTYLWSPDAIQCSTLDHSTWLVKNHTIVLRTEQDTLWHTETVNPFEDYYRLYGETPTVQIIGLYIQTISAGSSITVRADYDDLAASKIFEYVSCRKK